MGTALNPACRPPGNRANALCENPGRSREVPVRREQGGDDPEEPRPGGDDDERMRQLQKHRQNRAAKSIVLLGVLTLLVLFIVWNAHKVSVSFVFGDAEVGLIWVMLACAILGGIAGFIVGRPGRAFRFGRDDKDDKDDRDDSKR